MALNRERPHLVVLPEDDATRSLATGFVDATVGQMQVLNPAGGWCHVRDEMLEVQLTPLRKYGNRHLVLLIDFDDDFTNRMQDFKNAIPVDVANRVYVLGALSEAEELKKQTGIKLGPLGQALAKECAGNTTTLWSHPQLQHNQAEINRLNQAVKGFLF